MILYVMSLSTCLNSQSEASQALTSKSTIFLVKLSHQKWLSLDSAKKTQQLGQVRCLQCTLNDLKLPCSILLFQKSMSSDHNQAPNRPKHYDIIPLEKRRALIASVEQEERGGLKRAARMLGINEQTAKAIIRKYRRDGTIHEPRQLRLMPQQRQQERIELDQEDEAGEVVQSPVSLDHNLLEPAETMGAVQTVGVAWYSVFSPLPVCYQPIGMYQLTVPRRLGLSTGEALHRSHPTRQ